MEDWQLELIPRWEAIRAKGTSLGWHGDSSPYLATLASNCGMKWYAARGADKVAEFMTYDANDLFNGDLRFGRIKCHHLIEVLETASNAVDAPESAGENCGRTFTLTCADVLHLWGVPPEYPLHLLPLHTRLMNFCEIQKITTLPTLLEVWSTIGRAGLLAHENIGRRTANELQDFANAIANADAVAARRWLPLNDAENGLCLRRAFALGLGVLSRNVLTILTRRIVDKLKLEEVGIEHGITRERVRQLEAFYLREVREILTWFTAEHATMLGAWMEGREWQSWVLPQTPPEAATLVLAGIEACFEDTPQGVARRLSAEAEMQGWLEAVMNHSDFHLGGVDLQAFLDSNVPISKQVDFIAELSIKHGAIIDFSSGLVKPASPSVRDTIFVILRQEEAPIPLTWLAHRVQNIEGCEEGDAEFIFRNRYRWSQLGLLDLTKILWNE